MGFGKRSPNGWIISYVTSYFQKSIQLYLTDALLIRISNIGVVASVYHTVFFYAFTYEFPLVIKVITSGVLSALCYCCTFLLIYKKCPEIIAQQ